MRPGATEQFYLVHRAEWRDTAHINEPGRRPIRAQTFDENAAIREIMEEFGEDRRLKLLFGSIRTRVS